MAAEPWRPRGWKQRWESIYSPFLTWLFLVLATIGSATLLFNAIAPDQDRGSPPTTTPPNGSTTYPPERWDVDGDGVPEFVRLTPDGDVLAVHEVSRPRASEGATTLWAAAIAAAGGLGATAIGVWGTHLASQRRDARAAASEDDGSAATSPPRPPDPPRP